MATESIQADLRTEKIERWLRPSDPSTNANHARQLRHEGTGAWLLENPVFQEWHLGSRRYLWLHGPAGCGKTVLSATVLDHLAKGNDRRILSFFFNFNDTAKQTVDAMLRSLAFQLYRGKASSAGILDASFQAHQDGRDQLATKTLSDVLFKMLAVQKKVSIVLDALNESTTRAGLLLWIKDVVSRPELDHVQLICTGRPEPEFLRYIPSWIGEGNSLELNKQAGNQETDEIEIESVLSHPPSLTAGSTISSALTFVLREDLKANVSAILTNDKGFHELFQETPKRTTHEKFQRNFLRLFRSFLSDIRKQSDDGEQELRQAIRILRYQSRNIVSHICQEIFDLKEQSEALLSLAQQAPDKGGQLISFFGNRSAPELADAPKEYPLDEGDSSGGESEEPETVGSRPIPLGDLKIIILESTSFSTFRGRYRAFLFPRPDPRPLEAAIPTDSSDHTVAVDRSGPSIEPTSGLTIRPSLLREGFVFVKAQVERLIRPPVKEGYMRIEWRCDCSDDLYADFPESDSDSIRRLEASLKGHTAHAGGGTASSQASHPPGGVSALTLASESSPSLPASNNQSNNTGRTLSQNQPPAANGGTTQTSGPATGQAKKRFIELCVNIGEFQRQLAEIDISTVASDAQLFDRIRERYREVRSFRTRYFLLKPVDVHFVQFSVEDRHRVGILDKPMAIPSAAEMAAEGYTYHPCPLRPPPIPANIFLHHLSKPGQHPKMLWGNRIPQKLHKSILQIQPPNDLVTGWGVHIIEGLNKTTVLLCSLAGLLVNMIVAVVWAVVKNDVQGAFGIGAWLTSVEGIVVMLVVTQWLET